MLYLCYHGKAQDEEGEAADQGEERFMFPQVFGVLVRHGCHDGFDGGKLEKFEEEESDEMRKKSSSNLP